MSGMMDDVADPGLDILSPEELERLKQQLHDLSKEMARFIAIHEKVVEEIKQNEESRERRIEHYHDEIEEQIHTVRAILPELESIMTQAGAARWRVAAEEALKEGKGHVTAIRNLIENFKTVTDVNCARIDQVSKQAQERISKVVRSFRIEYLRRLAEDATQKTDEAAHDAIRRVTQVVKWFHWEHAAVALLVAVITAFITGMFINDEWPWEMHHHAATQRHAGQMLINAWPHLSEAERHRIEQLGHAEK